MNTSTSLSAIVAEHKWVPLAAFIIGLIVRVLKSDTKIPIDIPTRLRYPLAALLSVAAACIEKWAAGLSWGEAALDGVLAFILATNGHTFVIEVLRGGKEFAIPGLMVPGAAPAPGKSPTVPPKSGPPSIPPAVTGIMLLLLVSGCAFFKGADAPKRTLSVIQLACVAANAFFPNEAVMRACKIADEYGPQVADLVSAQRKAAASRGGDKTGAGGEASGLVCIDGDELRKCSP